MLFCKNGFILTLVKFFFEYNLLFLINLVNLPLKSVSPWSICFAGRSFPSLVALVSHLKKFLQYVIRSLQVILQLSLSSVLAIGEMMVYESFQLLHWFSYFLAWLNFTQLQSYLLHILSDLHASPSRRILYIFIISFADVLYLWCQCFYLSLELFVSFCSTFNKVLNVLL